MTKVFTILKTEYFFDHEGSELSTTICVGVFFDSDAASAFVVKQTALEAASVSSSDPGAEIIRSTIFYDHEAELMDSPPSLQD